MLTKFDRLPKKGQVLLFVELSALTARSIADALILLKNKGYEFDLRYSQEGEEIALYAVVKDEMFRPGMSRDYLSEEWEALTEAFYPDTHAVRSPRSFPKMEAIAA